MRAFAFLGFLILLSCGGSAQAITPDKSEFRRLADNVYAYLGKLNDANAMAIVTSQGVVLVDTGNNQPETRNLLKSIQSVTDQPVRYIIITQNHGDHVGGIPLFSPPATVIVHDRVVRDWAAMKPYQIKTWRKRFPERTEALKNATPVDNVVSFDNGMTLNAGGQLIELIYVDDAYNPGDVAVWLPQVGVLHGSFAAYKERHPDIRPDYSHGTTLGILKQLEALIALKPKIVVPAHGPVSETKDLQTMVDYVLLARQKVRVMLDKGLPLSEIEKQFDMHEFNDWDRGEHLEWTAATIYRELTGQGPERHSEVERQVTGSISRATEEGRRLVVAAAGGGEIRLRISNDTNIEGIADRSQFKAGMKVTAQYIEPQGGNPALGYNVMDINVER